jgi:hypothetical protein
MAPALALIETAKIARDRRTIGNTSPRRDKETIDVAHQSA